VDQNGYTRYWHGEAQVPWLYSPDAQVFITYDDPESLARKAGYVDEWDLGGVMFWELSADDGSLLDALYTRLRP
jgi:chitinase